MTGRITSRMTTAGRRWDARWRLDSGRKKSRTFATKKAAVAYLVKIVGRVHDGNYVEVRPVPMGDLFDRSLIHELDVRVHKGSIRASTARSYRSVLVEHLRTAFGHCR